MPAIPNCPDNLSKENMRAISAPYNFVPLSDYVHIPEWSKRASHDWPFEDGLSGEIHYTLVAESPLLVGGEQQKATGESPATVKPFKLPDGRYAIPGSSLKGMLRAVTEIAGFGRMRMVDDRCPGLRDITGKYVSKSYTSKIRGKVKSGFLERKRGSVFLVPCKMARLSHRDLEHVMGVKKPIFPSSPRDKSVSSKYKIWKKYCKKPGHNWSSIWFRPSDGMAKDLWSSTKSSKVGMPVFTGQISDSTTAKGKKHDFIFYDSNEDKSMEVSTEDWRDFLLLHGDQEKKGQHMAWPGYWRAVFRKGERVPVFYLKDGSRIRIGLAYMPKLAGDFSIHDCIRNSTEQHLEPPGTEGGYDLADLLFGAVNGTDKKASLRGRVNIEAAIADEVYKPEVQDDTILNSPKPSYFPNYLQQETDSSGMRLQKNNGDQEGEGQYSTYVGTASDIPPRLRGFKRYPVRPLGMTGVQQLTSWQERAKSVQVRLHTLPKGANFKGCITFHNLRPPELGLLLWVLTWGGDRGLRHGLGMGKPFGFGQVRFEVDEGCSKAVPNNPKSEVLKLDREGCNGLIREFISYMDKVLQKQGGWRNSPQIGNLRAMADPEAAVCLPNGMQLRHMCLNMRARPPVNEFVWAKQKALVLADYRQVTGWPAPATRQRWAEEAKALSEAERSFLELQNELAKLPEKVNRENYGVLTGLVNKYLEQARGWTMEEREKAANRICVIYEAYGAWSQPGQKSARKKRQREKKERQLELLVKGNADE